MKRTISPAIWGIVLIAIGVLSLLQSLGVLGTAMTLLWTALFALGGAAFLYVFLSNRARWWAIIPGVALLGIAALIGLEALFPSIGGIIGGTLFLGALALAFWLIYLMNRQLWWAIIPGGVLATLAIITLLEEIAPGVDAAWVLFLGMGLTFLLLSLVQTEQGRLKWALYPAGAMLLLGFIFMAQAASVLAFVWPGALVLVGLFFVLRSIRSRPQE